MVLVAGGRRSTLRTLAAIGLAAFVAYNAVQTFILDGWLGAATQERSEAQIELSGSLIAGGRPEMGASSALLAFNPWGFGSGTIPTFSDVLVAKTGMRSLNYQPNNGYVENYMFGGGFEVHSLLGDFWLRFGIVGAVLLVALVLTSLIGAARRLSAGTAAGLTMFLAIQVAWDALFSPLFFTSLNTLTLAVVLTIAVKTRPELPVPHLHRSRIVERGPSGASRTPSHADRRH